MREKLIELLAEHCAFKEKRCVGCDEGKYYRPECKTNLFGKIADHLIANGVTVQEWYSASNPPTEDGTYLVQTTTGTITTARFYAFKSFPATKYLPACHRSPSWQSNRNVVKWTFLPQPPKGE